MRDSHTFAFIGVQSYTTGIIANYKVHLPPRAPDPCFVTDASLVRQQPWAPAGSDSILCTLFDPAGRYSQTSNFPAQQLGGNCTVQGMNVLQVGAGFPNADFKHFANPIRYSRSAGDCFGADLASLQAGDYYFQVSWKAECPQSYPTMANPINGGDDLNTRLLLNFDEYPSVFRDFSAWPHYTILQGGAMISPIAKFGKGSLRPYGNANGSLAIVQTYDLILGASDWTWETWAYQITESNQQIIINQGAGFSPIQFGQNGGSYNFSASSAGAAWDVANQVSMGATVLNTWQHLAAIRSGNSITLWNNGVQQGAAVPVSGALYNPGINWSIGAAGGNIPFAGLIGETRFSNVARNPSLFPPIVSYGGA